MILKLFQWVLAVSLVGSLPTRAAPDFDPVSRPAFEYGPRPPEAVFDPNGFLDPGEADTISGSLETHLKADGVDVLVVVLRDLGNATPEHVANSFSAAWCESPIHCVVLHVPGREGSPWLVPGGRRLRELDAVMVRQAVVDAMRRAAAETKDTDKVKAAATEAADLLRFWSANVLKRTELVEFEKARMRLELETHAQQWKIATTVVVISLIPLGLGTWLVGGMLRKRGPAFFPTPDRGPRLGAPHSGGNRAVVDLGRPPR